MPKERRNPSPRVEKTRVLEATRIDNLITMHHARSYRRVQSVMNDPVAATRVEMFLGEHMYILQYSSTTCE